MFYAIGLYFTAKRAKTDAKEIIDSHLIKCIEDWLSVDDNGFKVERLHQIVAEARGKQQHKQSIEDFNKTIEEINKILDN